MLFGIEDPSLINKLEYDNVVITLGDKGSIVKEKEKIYHINSKKVVPLNTTGAGDTYNGVLAAALLDVNNLFEACSIASTAASISVTKEFVIDSIPYKEEIK